MGRRRLVAKKTLLGSAVIPLYVFAVQAALQGDLYTAGAAAGIATGLFAAYEVVGLRALPVDLEELQELSEEIGDAARDTASRGGLDGVERDPETGQFRSAESSADQQDGGAS